jgi:hypothetical protein
MQKRLILTVSLACSIACVSLPRAEGQELPRFGIAVGAGSLGAGIEAATAVARKTNLRFGFNYFSLDLSGTDSKNDIKYNANLRLESFEVLMDQYVKGPFHVSAGALVYDGFRGSGSVNVPAEQTFNLNSVTYTSALGDPVTGTASIGARKIAPELLIGFGNLLPRNRRHFTANLDLGVAFQGSPNAKLNLAGSVCASAHLGCATIASQPTVMANILAEQNKVNDQLKPFQFYPIIRLTFGYKF